MKRVYQLENQSLLFIVILGSLTAFGPLAIDMFLPGLPNISHDFDISASTTQLTISFFMIGLALGNFLAGPISDITGRKKPLIFSLIIFTIASLGIIFVTNIWIMIILRFIQGLTGGAGAVISRAIASDMYSGNALTKFLSLL
ncbi:MFS transporter, partial [Staphylococcus epidermidis]